MFYLFLTSLLWGISYGLTKDLLSGMDSFSVISIRLGIALLVFIPFFRPLRLPITSLGKLFCIGMLQQGAAYLFYIEGLKRLESYEVAFYMILIPIYVSLIFDLREKHLNWRRISTSCLAVLGSFLIHPFSFNSTHHLWGILSIQVCHLCFAWGQVEYKLMQPQLKGSPILKHMAIMYSGALFLVLAVSMAAGGQISVATIDQNGWYTLIYLGAISTGLGFMLWNKGIISVSKGVASIMNNVKAPVGMLCSIFIFKETVAILPLFLGGSIILLALFWENLFSKKAEESESITESLPQKPAG